MTARTRLVILLVSTPLVAFALVGGLLGKASAREESYQALRVFEDVASLIVNNYVEEVDIDRMMDGAMRGLADALDAQSAWLDRSLVAQVEQQTGWPEGDVGVDLTRQYYLRIVAARDGSPAARAGLRTGDYVRAIDGRSTRTLSVIEGQRLLRGPVGSTVKLLVLRGSAAEPHEVSVLRERLSGPDVTGRMLADGIGLVRIAGFSKGTAGEVARLVGELEREGARRLVLDLRGSAFGTPADGVATARLFVRDAVITQREVRGQQPDPMTATAADGRITLPLAVLTTAGTAGAAEVLVAALAEHKRATVVGERTFGRAAEQKLVRLTDGSGLWLTFARYLTPGGKPIHGQGIEPHEAVEDPDVEFGAGPPERDPILERAVELLRTAGVA